jgi:exopolyphosphatase/guanosine-5'-triphosphate,3'-diphosphate pyrophosphatase
MIADKSQRIGIIDLGSNTARVIVMQAVSGYAYRLEDEIREVVRLRQGMTIHGLSEEAMTRAIFTLRLFKRFCKSLRIDKITATATAATREAANGPLFLERVQQEVGLSLRVLDGEQEAYYGTIGALNEVALVDGYILDIGGGSAQISQVRDRQFVRGQSLPLGALALTELLVTTDPIAKTEFRRIQEEIEGRLAPVSWLGKSEGPLVGLGGTIRNLARIEAARQGYPLNTLHGFVLSQQSIEESIELFRALPLDERRAISGLKADRADIILPGAMVLLAVMNNLNASQLTVSNNGLREGLFFEQFWQHLDYPVVTDVRRFSVLNMARIYQYQKNHALHVRFLARQLFDQLIPLHGYGPAERQLLDSAALLHDIGTIISYEGHHKHSQTLITNSGLSGFTPAEIAKIALLARYHRSGSPSTKEYRLLLEEPDELLVSRLAAMLRLAEYLERGRNATVDDISVGWTDNELRLTLIADEYPAVELWEAERQAADLMENAFQRQVVIGSTAAP